MSGSCMPLLFQLPILWGLYGVVREPLKYVLEIPTEFVNALSSVAKTTLGLTGNSAAYAESAAIANLDALIMKIPATAAKYPDAIERIRNFDFTVFGVDLGAIPQFSTLKSLGSASTEAKVLLLIPLLSFATSMLTSVLTQVRQKKNNPGAMENAQMMGCMMLMTPLMSLWFTFQFPAGMGMYWILSNVLAFFQTLILGKIYAPRKTVAKLMVDETIYRRSYEKTKTPVSASED